MKEGRVWMGVVSKEEAAALDYSSSATPATSGGAPDSNEDVSLTTLFYCIPQPVLLLSAGGANWKHGGAPAASPGSRGV